MDQRSFTYAVSTKKNGHFFGKIHFKVLKASEWVNIILLSFIFGNNEFQYRFPVEAILFVYKCTTFTANQQRLVS